MLAHVLPHNILPVGIHEVRLGERDNTLPYIQQPKDVQMLNRLGHHALIGRHYQQRHIHTACPGQHVLDEPGVPGDIHDAGEGAVRKPKRGEPQVNGHAALLLLLQPIRIRAGERTDKRGLAVVHMAGRADNDALHDPG